MEKRKDIWKDHVIGEEVWIPGASHVTMIAGALLEKENKNDQNRLVEVSDLIIQKPIVAKEGMKIACILQESGKTEIQTEDENGVKETKVLASNVAFGSEGSLPKGVDLGALKMRCTEQVDVDSAYEAYDSVGIKYGDTFRTVIEAWKGDDEVVARVGITRRPLLAWERALTLVHPAILDGAFQITGMCAASNTNHAFVPFHVQRAALSTQKEQGEVWAHAVLKQSTSSSITADVTLMMSSGKVVGFVEGLTARRLSSTETTPIECLYETEWVEVSSKLDSLAENRVTQHHRLLISFAPIRVEDSTWLNVVHANGCIGRIEKEEHCVEVDLKVDMASVLKEVGWESIVLLANGQDMLLVAELGLLLIKEIDKLVQLGEWTNAVTVWFLTEHQPKSVERSAAGLWAMARTARVEIPDIGIKCVELEREVASSGHISEICDFAGSFKDEPEFRFKSDDTLQVPRLVRLKSPRDKTSTRPIEINSSGSYVISGGLGALGLVVARWLVDSGASHILLLSRSQKADASQELSELKQHASDVAASIEWCQCDVSSIESVNTAQLFLEQTLKWPKVAGVFHTAGVLADGTIRNLDSEALHTSYAPKVFGAINLRQAFSPSGFIVLFSSISAVFGSPGQANYSAANATLDELAESWCAKGENALSIQWGAWSEGGMALNNEDTT